MIVDVNVNARESRLPRRNVTLMGRGGGEPRTGRNPLNYARLFLSIGYP